MTSPSPDGVSAVHAEATSVTDKSPAAVARARIAIDLRMKTNLSVSQCPRVIKNTLAATCAIGCDCECMSALSACQGKNLGSVHQHGRGWRARAVPPLTTDTQ